MTDRPDDILKAAEAIKAQVAGMDQDDPRRAPLEAKRQTLRREAQSLLDDRRHPSSVANEIAMLEARLDEIADLQITDGYAQKRLGKTIQDPGAYSHNINLLLAEEHAGEVAAINMALDRLRPLAAQEEAS